MYVTYLNYYNVVLIRKFLTMMTASSNLEKSHKIRLYTPSDILESLDLENSIADNSAYDDRNIPVDFETLIPPKMIHFFHKELPMIIFPELYSLRNKN